MYTNYSFINVICFFIDFPEIGPDLASSCDFCVASTPLSRATSTEVVCSMVSSCGSSTPLCSSQAMINSNRTFFLLNKRVRPGKKNFGSGQLIFENWSGGLVELFSFF